MAHEAVEVGGMSNYMDNHLEEDEWGRLKVKADDHLTETFHPIEKDPSGLSPHQPGAKLDAGKVQAALLQDFAFALLAVAEVGTFGANKYSRGGWQSVENGETRYSDALWRHLLKGRHEAIDPDSNLTHAAHAAWNALAVLELALRQEAELETTRETNG